MKTPGEKAGAVSHIQTFCLHDGEGIRTTVFFAGCPLRCRWCANPETWDTSRARSMGVAQIVSRCDRDRIFYRHSGGGVTISGGEPGLQPEFLTALLNTLATEGIDTAIETSGCFALAPMAETIRLVDFLFIDLKHMETTHHRQLTGHGNELILDNIKRIGALGKDMVIRLPLIPGVNDQEDNLTATAGFVARHVPGRRIEVLPYHDWARQKYTRLGLPWTTYRPPDRPERDRARALLAAAGAELVDFS
ncbi:MAG: glycyl-radical enzyme activating protein [Desulfopila sp.]